MFLHFAVVDTPQRVVAWEISGLDVYMVAGREVTDAELGAVVSHVISTFRSPDGPTGVHNDRAA